MSDKPLVSICIPNYNNALYIGEAIQSALDQTYENFEIIVADNRSTDNSWEVIQSYASDARLKCYLNDSNLGMVGNFREVFNKAQGKYISFLCSDDLLKKGTIKILVEKMETNSECSFAFGNVEYCGNRIGQSNFVFPEIIEERGWVKASINAGGNRAFLVGTVIRKTSEKSEEIIADLTFFDWYLWLKLGKSKVAFTETIVGVHRYHQNNQTRQLTTGFIDNYQQLRLVIIKSYEDGHLTRKEAKKISKKMTLLWSTYFFSTSNLKCYTLRSIVAGYKFCRGEFSGVSILIEYFFILMRVFAMKVLRRIEF